MTSLAIMILRDRLETGWSPKADQIDPDVRQVDALNWSWSADGKSIFCQTIDRLEKRYGDILYVSPHQDYALTSIAFLWLYDDEESEKVRFLGG